MFLMQWSRENMQALKAQKEGEAHTMKIHAIVKQIYRGAVYSAEIKSETVYRVPINLVTGGGQVCVPSNVEEGMHNLTITKEFVIEHMETILTCLRQHFPDCVVEYKKVSLATGRDGKEYDISAVDDAVRPFIDINRARTDTYIVVDWS